MPLKHDTETVLVFLLGLMIALAGMVSAFLPPLSVSVWPWAVAFTVSMLYPLVLYPLLKARRADYEFRLLHFGPAVILFLWLVLELLASARPRLQIVQSLFTTAWSGAAVSLLFGFLVLFCLLVLRQRVKRVGLLLLVFVPFLVLSQWSDAHSWDQRLTATLWQGITGTGIIALNPIGNTAPSQDIVEEQWRVQLRQMEQRSAALREQVQSGGNLIAAVLPSSSSVSSVSRSLSGSSSSRPISLPSSGPDPSLLAVTLMALYTGAVHRKAVRRLRNA